MIYAHERKELHKEKIDIDRFKEVIEEVKVEKTKKAYGLQDSKVLEYVKEVLKRYNDSYLKMSKNENMNNYILMKDLFDGLLVHVVGEDKAALKHDIVQLMSACLKALGDIES